jgi:hypothetical protein
MKKVDRIKETEKVMDRISALEAITPMPEAKGINGEPMHVFRKFEIIEEILNEYVKRYTYLEGAKEYMVHFEGGGWNTCYGRDEEEALVNACLEFDKPEDDRSCALKVSSVSIVGGPLAKEYMNLFD